MATLTPTDMPAHCAPRSAPQFPPSSHPFPTHFAPGSHPLHPNSHRNQQRCMQLERFATVMSNGPCFVWPSAPQRVVRLDHKHELMVQSIHCTNNHRHAHTRTKMVN
jgi:hypothetical protein